MNNDSSEDNDLKASITGGSVIDTKIYTTSESHYLIDANRQRCKEIFAKQQWEHGELIDGYIALHIVLEAGLNSLYRQLALRSLKKGVDRIKVMQNIDAISFIHKSTLFIYNSKFNFDDKLDQATKYHKIIGTLKQFCQTRNALLHGHAIATISGDDVNEPRDTEIRRSIASGEEVKKQLNRFRFITDGMIFYLDCLEGLADNDRAFYKTAYLGYDFLPADFV